MLRQRQFLASQANSSATNLLKQTWLPRDYEDPRGSTPEGESRTTVANALAEAPDTARGSHKLLSASR